MKNNDLMEIKNKLLLYYSKEELVEFHIDAVDRIDKAIEEIKKILEMAKDYEMVNLVDRLENILDILRGENNE